MTMPVNSFWSEKPLCKSQGSFALNWKPVSQSLSLFGQVKKHGFYVPSIVPSFLLL